MADRKANRDIDHYQRMEDVLGWIEEHIEQQPTLREIASTTGLTEFHFQRIFSRWVGVSPKKYVQFLTLEHAKSALRASADLLDATYSAGLSGPSRLHDLFVGIDAMSPGEYKQRGRGLDVVYGWHETPFGEVALLATERGVCGLGFSMGRSRELVLKELSEGYENATFREEHRATAAFVENIFFAGKSTRERITLLLRGTPFQLKVWHALLRIPEGALVTYADIACLAGNAKAVRAAATATGNNPVAYLIPCHRVIRKSGAMGGYRWGVGRKVAMLSSEAGTHSSANANALM